MKAFGVGGFVVGVGALGALVIRRGRGTPVGGTDYLLMFIGLAGAIGGIAAMFVEL